MTRAVAVTWLGILLLCGAKAACAEKVILKSGRVIEGEVLERTPEHIRIKTERTTYQIPWKMVDEQPAANSPPDVPSGRTAAEWMAWSQENQEYLKKADSIRKQFSRTLADAVWGITQALKAEDFGQIARLSKYAADRARFQLKELDKLAPPAELTGYHRDLREAIQLTLKFIDAVSLSDQQNYYRYSRRAYDRLIAALESLRDAQRVMGAPSEEVLKFTEVVERTRKTFEKRF